MNDFNWTTTPSPSGEPAQAAKFAGVRALVVGRRWAVQANGRRTRKGSGLDHRDALRTARFAAHTEALKARLSRRGGGS